MIRILLALAISQPAIASDAVPARATAELITRYIAGYEAVRIALRNDQLSGAQSAAQQLVALTPGDTPMITAAAAITAATELHSARVGFGALSQVLIARLGSATAAPKVWAYFCPMFDGFAWWIQAKPGIANPYMGESMPACGEETSLKAATKAAVQAETKAAP
jgi:hypothetical protein